MKKTATLILFLLTSGLFAQNDTVIFTERGHFFYSQPLFTFYAVYSPLIDRMGRPYVYTASQELGMVTFDISNQNMPHPVDTITPAMLGNEHAASVAQDSNYLFIGKGVFQSSGQRAGLAIYDISNPLIPVLVDQWDSAAYTNGTSQVLLQGNYAYLAAMQYGVIILDISNRNDIRFVSNFVPTTLPNTGFSPNARGLFISHDTLLVAYDGGGLRVIDVTNKYAPVQIGAYLNAAATANNSKPYYNHVWRIGDKAYIPIDYMGLEVDDVSNPSNITTTGWNNVWNNSGFGAWGGSDGHANEIAWADPVANVLMVSGGDSQVLAFDPTNPSSPRVMGAWGVPNTDSLGSWGVDVFGNTVAIGIMKTPGPFYSDSGGLQLLNWTFITAMHEYEMRTGQLKLYPNPASAICTIELPASPNDLFTIEVIDVMGRIVLTENADPKLNNRNVEIDLSDLAPGIYSVRVTGEELLYSGKIIKK
jgi:hypothetical protein